MDLLHFIKLNLTVQDFQVKNTISLLDGGATLPFIARYRKEMTGGLDETQIEKISTLKKSYDNIIKRQVFILKTIKEHNKLNSKLEKSIIQCFDLNELEDIYLPYKQKKKTRATKAKEIGLEPLAKMILEQDEDLELEYQAQQLISDFAPTIENVLQGARDIIAENISEDSFVRDFIRKRYYRETIIKSKIIAKKENEKDADKYKDYFKFQEDISKIPAHRLLAILRAEKEGFLSISLENLNQKSIIQEVENQYINTDNKFIKRHISLAIKDSFDRLIHPSLETEFINNLVEKAEEKSIEIFKKNLEQLLLSPPLGKKNILAIDPGFRTGCKVVCLDNQGNLKHNDIIFIINEKKEYEKSKAKILSLISKYNIEAIAIGDGTASRETETFIKTMNLQKIQTFTISEDGASIYSASKIAIDEFPKHDITVRGAVSIGRRLMDPLSELVKIDPKSLGIGQYQHDVNQTKLKKSLYSTVEICVNKVGVNINTSSSHILKHISGIGETLAKSIIEYRTQNGPFLDREDFLKIPKLGKKVFEQCAGFLRIDNPKNNPLDNSSVHPERYSLVKKMCDDIGVSVKDIIGNIELINKINIKNYVSEEIGEPTLEDILKELNKPGLDPRDEFVNFNFSENIKSINDLKKGMVIPGIVKNITNFGVFVDIGIKENGLIHISEMSNDAFISNPSDILSIHQKLIVKIIEIDIDRKRIALSLKN